MKIDKNYQKIKKIKCLLLDVDGVLTDSKLYLDNNGVESKSFNSKDGLGLRMLQDSGIEVGIITGRKSNIVKIRANELGFKYIYQNRKHKLPAFEEFLIESGFNPDEVSYVGDDLIDLPILNRVGFAVAVADSHKIIMQMADWVTTCNGGCGAVREVCEKIMLTQGLFDEQLARFNL
jgi:3-deoxy-D-manno-octulosonate 8-phosphate phosphatase (KDO 8-P phosphatase)